MYKIKFGTDGWRAIIADKFTVDNVARLSMGLAKWANEISDKPCVVVGHDCRFAGKLFCETVAKVLLSQGVEVILSEVYVSTPALSLATRDYECVAGVVITASHNPPSYNGFKLKASFGGPMQAEDLGKIESYIPDHIDINLDDIKLNPEKDSLLSYKDIEGLYIQKIEKNFDLEAIRNAKLGLAYDAMYGSGQNVIRKILPGIKFFRCEENPSFNGLSPEPILRNLLPYSDFIKNDPRIKIGLATDGDADRIGLMDEDGSFIDSHHIMLLLIHYLHKYQGKSGKVVIGFSSVNKLKKLCAHYDLPVEVVKIGFKYAAGIIIKEKVLVGGEESGGIAVEGHIPERDGIWIGLMLWEFMAKSGKTLRELINEVYEIVGPFNFKRDDLHLDQKLKEKIVGNCEAGKYESFGKYQVTHIDDMDGWKYNLTENSWVMIRPSGTEPVLRIYSEASTEQETADIIKACKETILNTTV